ncbi:hypothetical protein Tco_0507404, partial [Tanacetum coccineum]
IPTTTRSGMTPAMIEEMIERRMTEALEAYKANRNRKPTMESRMNMRMIMEMTMETVREMEAKMVMGMNWVEEMGMEILI